MFAKIIHKGLNSKKEASKLHGMISDGYRNKFKKEEKPVQSLPEDKEEFIKDIKTLENEFLCGGFYYG